MKIQLILSLLIVLLVLSCKQKDNTKTEQDKTDSKSEHPVIAVGKGPDALFVTPDKKFIYVANVEDTIISIINSEKNEVIKNIYGVRKPWGFVRIGTTNLVAVSGYDQQIAIIDFNTHEIVRQKNYEQNLGGITASKGGDLLYVVDISNNKALKIDAESLGTIEQYPTGKGPDGIGISQDDNKLYVTNTEDGNISVINIGSKDTSQIKTGGKPELVHPNHDHSLLFISNFSKNKVHMVNTMEDKIIHEIEGLDGPEETVPSEDGKRLYVVNFNLSKVFVYDASTYKKLEEEYPTGNKPIGLKQINNRLYISNYGDNSVSVIMTNSEYGLE